MSAWKQEIIGVQVPGYTGYVVDNGRIGRKRATFPNLDQPPARVYFDYLLALKLGAPARLAPCAAAP